MDSETYSVKGIKIFLSYSIKDKHKVGELKDDLERVGFGFFLAHEDINPSYEWQEEIYKNILDCDIFIPYITKYFKESDWTDQECGIAYKQSKLIIPLQVEITPYGFLNKIQALKFNPEKISSETDEIVRVILNSNKFGDLKDFFIEQFIKSGCYINANENSKRLRYYDNFSEEEVKKICEGSLRNDQVLGAFTARLFLRKLVYDYEEYVDPTDLSILKKEFLKRQK